MATLPATSGAFLAAPPLQRRPLQRLCVGHPEVDFRYRFEAAAILCVAFSGSRLLKAARPQSWLERLVFPKQGKTCPQRGVRLACRAVAPDRRGVSRWILVSRGRPRLEDDPTGDLMREVETVWHSLEPDFMYLPREDRLRALSALCVAALAHQGQCRKSGEPYLIHPVAVAKLLASLKAEADVLISGLLHDTVEDNMEIGFEDLEAIFGHDVRRIVEGETKASKRAKVGTKGLGLDLLSPLFRRLPGANESQVVSSADEQAENLRSMFMAMADDSRVILVKLADRLHNMRTLQHMREAKRFIIAAETLTIFVPLAHRLGVWAFKTELEDLCFKFLWPEEYARMDALFMKRRIQYGKFLNPAVRDLKELLERDPKIKEQHVRLRITGREKGMYSSWDKLRRKPAYHNNLDNIRDIIALRVVLDFDRLPKETDADYKTRGNELCYHTLAVTRNLHHWAPPDGGPCIKDYIRYPKPNGYQSLHTILVRCSTAVPLELQVRTRQMHAVAEFGNASHWVYKGEQHSEHRTTGKRKSKRVAWLASLKDKNRDGSIDPYQFVQEVLRDELGKRCFVFLRDGRILNLSRGCTALDAAFKIHTEVGMRMQHAVVNDVIVDPSYVLQNGDKINIVTLPYARPSREWIHCVWLRSTRNKLQAFFRKQDNAEREELDVAAAVATVSTLAGTSQVMMGGLPLPGTF